MIGVDAYVQAYTAGWQTTGAVQVSPSSGPTVTHEQFVHSVREAILDRAPEPWRTELASAKLVYGVGPGSYRGVCFYQAWQNGQPGRACVIEIAATGEESDTQLMGTTLHECAHVLAGNSAGHGQAWKDACQRLGLERALAAGQDYQELDFHPTVWQRLNALPKPSDGRPAFALAGGGFIGLPPSAVRPCPLGTGTRGGKSRGKGSGSRMRLYHCLCEPPVKVRHAGDELAAHCDHCGAAFAIQAKT